MRHRFRNTQMFALARPPAERMELAGATYVLERVFKHDFWAATCLYERKRGQATLSAVQTESTQEKRGTMENGDSHHFPPRKMETVPLFPWPPAKAVVKFGRVQPFWGFPLEWVGRLLRANEREAYRLLEGVPGVPRWIASSGRTGYAVEYVEGRALDRKEAPPTGFFDRLRELFDALHARGLAYCDSNKRSNILIGLDGRPWLVDYQISVRRRDDLPWPLRAMVAAAVRYLATADLYHLYQHKRRLAPRELRPEEEALARKPTGLLALHRMLTDPYRALRRRFLRQQYEKGALESPTAGLEDYYMPEKDSWRSRPEERK
jgi:hypothetical protein